MLHITNGDSAAGPIRGIVAPEPAICWKDVIHEGPWVSGDATTVRARFLAGCGWGEYNDLLAEMNERDTRTRGAEALTLWFEHDLYDQLQLIQILDMVRDSKPVWLVQTSDYLGTMSLESIRSAFQLRTRATPQQTDLATRAWHAFVNGTAAPLEDLLQYDTNALPHLKAALERHLEEFPSDRDGLGRTEKQILQAVAQGHSTFVQAFAASQKMESAIYMGDSSFALYIHRLKPLIGSEPYQLSALGTRVLGGQERFQRTTE